MATFEEFKPKLDKALQYLKKCDDYTTLEAQEAFYTIRSGSKADRQKIGLYLVDQGYGQLLSRIWNGLRALLKKENWGQHGWTNLMVMLRTSTYVKSCPELAEEFGNSGIIQLILAGLDQLQKYYDDGESESDLPELLASILMFLLPSMSKCSRNRNIYRDANAVVILKKYLKSKIEMIPFLCLMIMSYIVDESESDILRSEGVVKWLVKGLQVQLDSSHPEDGPFSAKELLDCLNRLAINDQNKVEIEKQGGIPFIVRMLQDDHNEEDQTIAAEAVWNLSFQDSIRTSPQLQEAIPLLDKHRKSANRNLRNACEMAFWEINHNRDEDLPAKESTPQGPPPSYEESVKKPTQTTANTPKVMISYQWDSQTIAVKVRDDLVKNGYKVWLDLTDMEDDILNSMAEAVEKSEIILMCMSEPYKNSQNCRTEAKFAYREKKKVIPLLVEKDYKPDGWLGAVLGTKLYYKFFTEDLTQTDMPLLLRALEKSTKEKRICDKSEGSSGSTQDTERQVSTPTKPSVSSWTGTDVQEWLKNKKLEALCDTLDDLDGNHLDKMYRDYCRDPKEFKDEMKSDYEMSGKLCLKFTVALEQLFKN